MVHMKKSHIWNWLSDVHGHFDTHIQNHYDGFNGLQGPNHDQKDGGRQNCKKVSRSQTRKQGSNNTQENDILKILRHGNVNGLDPFPVKNDYIFRNAALPHNYHERGKRNWSEHAKNSPNADVLRVREYPRLTGRREVFDSSDEKMQSFQQAYDLGRAENESRRTMKNKHERQPRAKTRADRYQPKTGKPHKRLVSASAQGQNKRSRRKSKRRSLINEDFNAVNVTADRVTIRSGHRTGIFGNGRASTPVRPRDLPDLTFSEMRFLRKHRDKNESRVSPLEIPKSPQMIPAKIVQREIPQYYTNDGTHANIKGGRERSNNHMSKMREYLELTSSAIHYPCYGSPTPPSGQRSVINHSNEHQLLTRKSSFTNIASQKPQMDSGPTVPYIWSDSEPADDSKDMDPSLLTYVTGILLDSLNSGNGRHEENCDETKVYYDLEDLQRLCSDQERCGGFEDESLKNANSRIGAKGSQHLMKTRNSRHSSSNRGRLPKVTEVPRRYHHQKSPRHNATLDSTVSADFLGDYTSHNKQVRTKNTSKRSVSPTHRQILPPEGTEKSTACCTKPLEARHVGQIEIETDHECFGQHRENSASIDLQTEYAISASIPSVDDVLYNLYRNSFSVEELQEIEKNNEINIWELDNKAGTSHLGSQVANECAKRVAPDTSPSRKFCNLSYQSQILLTGVQDELYDRLSDSPGQDKEILCESKDMLLPDGFLPLAQHISNSNHHSGASEARLHLIPGTSYASTDQPITWRHSPLPTAGFASQNHYMRDATTGFLEHTHNCDGSNGTADEDYGPPGFWRQNRLY